MKATILKAVLGTSLLMMSACGAFSQGFIVDHTCVDVSKLDQQTLDKARQLNVFFGHMSVGQNIMDGMQDLENADPVRYQFDTSGWVSKSWYDTHHGIGQRTVGQNGKPALKMDEFYSLIVDDKLGEVIQAGMLKLCFSDLREGAEPTPTFEYLRTKMEDLERLYPNVKFVWFTDPVCVTNWDDGRKDVYNALVRNYCKASNKILFDVADIESHDPSGNAIKDQFNYEALYEAYSTDGGHLSVAGQDRVAGAVWWLLSRLSGWNPTSSTHVKSKSDQVKNGKWNLISIPVDPVDGDPLNVLSGIDVPNASLQYWMNGDKGGFQSFGASNNWTGPLKRGTPYWLLETKSGPDKTIEYDGTPSASSFEMTVPAHSEAPYWIMIGTPSLAEISCENISFRNTAVSADFMSWDNAIKAKIIESKAIGFDIDTQTYFTAGPLATIPDKSVLEPWHGYWLLVSRPEELTIAFPNSSGS